MKCQCVARRSVEDIAKGYTTETANEYVNEEHIGLWHLSFIILKTCVFVGPLSCQANAYARLKIHSNLLASR